MLILLCLCAHAFVLRSKLSPYQNDYDGDMRFNSGFMKDQILTGMWSTHNNHHEDRRWRFYYGSASGVQCFRQRWTSYMNSFDGNLDFTCGTNQALSGISSYHKNKNEDRRWKFQCCKVKPYDLHSEYTTSYINSWDGRLDFKCGLNQVLVGVKSHHNNGREDRLWQARCATLSTHVFVNGIVGGSSRTDYLNRFDKRLKHSLPNSNEVITGLDSYHDNDKEDRRFRIYRARLTGVHCKRSWWSDTINKYDGGMNYQCGGNRAMVGLHSWHNNRREDRRWKVKCCDLSNGGKYAGVSTYLSGYANEYDGRMNFRCPSNAFMVGIYSHHNDRREDRRFKFYCGRFYNNGGPTSWTGGRSLEVQRGSYFFDKKIDDIFIIMTHNSLALPGKVFSPNQNRGLARQFRDGVRGFNLDLKANGNKIKSCHGKHWLVSWWCYNPKDQIRDLMNELNKDWYDDSFIIVQLESKIKTQHYHLLENWFGSKLVKNFNKNKKLGYYMERGQQVLIFTDGDARPSQGIHDTNDYIVENHYEWKSTRKRPPMWRRRGPVSGTRIRLMNNFHTLLGAGNMLLSIDANNYKKALRHIKSYKQQTYADGKINMLMVDYYETGQVFKIQQTMRS